MGLLADLSATRRPLAAFVCVGVGWGSVAALMPALKAQIGASDALYGALVLFGSIGAVLAMWLAPLALKLAGRWALILASLLIGTGLVAAATASGPFFFAMGMFVSASASGIADVLANSEVADTESETGRGLMNLNHGLYALAFAAASLGTGGLRAFDWGAVSIMSVAALVIAGLCLLMKPPRAVTLHAPGAPTVAVPQLAIVWLIGLVVLSAFLLEAAVEGWSALHLERTLDAPPAAGATGPAIFAAMMTLGRFTGHMVAGRVSDLLMIGLACFASAIGLFVVAAAGSVVMVYIGLGLGGLGISVVAPLAIALAGRSVPPHARLRAISRVSVLGYGAYFVGPPAMGFVSELFGLRAAFVMVATALVLVATLLVPLLARQLARVPQDA